MVDVGDVALKIAGRDAGNLCVVVEVLDGNFVLIDGETRRKKCNILHLEFLGKKAKVKKGASTSEVVKALSASGFSLKEVKKGKKKESKAKPTRKRKEPSKKAEKKVSEKIAKKK